MRGDVQDEAALASTFTTGASSLVGAVGPSVERWGRALVPRPDSRPISFITLADVTRATVAAALHPEGALVAELGGPEALTLGEAARRVDQVLGKNVRVMGVPRTVMGLTRRAAERRDFDLYEAMLFLEMLADEGYHCDPAPARRLLGR